MYSTYKRIPSTMSVFWNKRLNVSSFPKWWNVFHLQCTLVEKQRSILHFGCTPFIKQWITFNIKCVHCICCFSTNELSVVLLSKWWIRKVEVCIVGHQFDAKFWRRSDRYFQRMLYYFGRYITKLLLRVKYIVMVYIGWWRYI